MGIDLANVDISPPAAAIRQAWDDGWKLVFRQILPSRDRQNGGYWQPGPLRKNTEAHVEAFAVEGLRTLVIGQRELLPAEWEKFAEAKRQADSVVTGRAEALAAVPGMRNANTQLESLLMEPVQRVTR